MAKKKSKAPQSKNQKSAQKQVSIAEVSAPTSQTELSKRAEIIGLLPLIGATIVLLIVVFVFVLGRMQNMPISQDTVTSTSSSVSSLGSIASPIQSTASSSSTVSAQSTGTTSEGRISEGNAGSTTSATYSFIAGRGESVSKLARKAINQYLEERGVTMSRAQRLFMEVNLTNANNPVHMEIGEGRTFSVSQISSLYDQALNLSSSSLRAWERQAASVSFR